MWPFKKPDTRPRILLVDHWRDSGALDMSIQPVEKLAGYFIFKRYSSDVFVLQPGGTVRAAPKFTWEKIDDIPGLTDVAVPVANPEGKGDATASEPSS